MTQILNTILITIYRVYEQGDCLFIEPDCMGE